MNNAKENSMKISVEEALKRIAAGKMVIVTDHEDRENEGDLVGAARFATPEMVNFMAGNGRGLICVALEESLCERAGLSLMDQNDGPEAMHGTRFCTPIDAIQGCTTGISAYDRSATLTRLCADDCRAEDFARPGHMFPIMEADGGLAVRQGHTEASVYLAREAGLEGAAVICEMMDVDGHMVRGGRIDELAREWNLGTLSVNDIVKYFELKRAGESDAGDKSFRVLPELKLPTESGEFCMEFINAEEDASDEHFCLFKNDSASSHINGPLVRIHSECLTGDLLGSRRCDCGPQLDEARRRIEGEGAGYLIYLRQEGRGIGLRAKIKAYHLQDNGLDTLDANLHLGYPADDRDYRMAADYLLKKGVRKIRLMTNNPDKINQMEKAGLEVVRVPLIVGRGTRTASISEPSRIGWGICPPEDYKQF